MAAVKDKSGDVTLKRDGDPLYIIPAPVVEDAKGERDEKAYYEIKADKTGTYLTVKLSCDWIGDSKRSYPINVDPTIKKYRKKERISLLGEFVCIMSDGIKTSKADELHVGADKSKVYRTYMKPELPTIPDGAVVTDASLKLTINKTDDDNPSGRTYLYPVSAKPGYKYENAVRNGKSTERISPDSADWKTQWDTDNISWKNQPADKEPELVGIPEDFAGMDEIELDITNIAKDAMERKNPYHGFYLRGIETSDRTKKNVKIQQSSSTPYLTVTYRDFTGTEQYLSAHDQDAGAAGKGSINDYTGYLTFVHEDVKSAGERMAMSVSHVYHPVFGLRSDEKKWLSGEPYGNHFMLSTDERITVPVDECDVKKYPYVYTDADGTRHYFKKKDVTIYENGEEREIENSDTAEHPSAKDEDGLGLYIVRVRDSKLKEKYPLKLTDKSGSIVKYFDASGYLCMVADSNQKEDASNKSSREQNRILIEHEVTNADCTAKDKEVLDDIIGRLEGETITSDNHVEIAEGFIAEIEKLAADSYTFSVNYDLARKLQLSEAELESIRDSKSGYESSKTTIVNRLKKISETIGDGSLGIAVKRTVSVTDAAGQKAELHYDEKGRLSEMSDPSQEGRRVKYAYDEAGNLTGITHELKDGKTKGGSYSYDNNGNLIKAISDTGNGMEYEYADKGALPVKGVIELFGKKGKLIRGQSLLIEQDATDGTVFVSSGRDGKLGGKKYKYDKKSADYKSSLNKNAKDDIENVYLFDKKGRTVSVVSRMREGKDVIGADGYEYTDDEDDESGSGDANHLKEEVRTGHPAVNLLKNSGFETSDDWSDIKRDTSKKYMGKAAALIAYDSAKKEISQTVTIKESGTYCASAYVHTQGITDGTSHAGIRVYVNGKLVSGEASADEAEDEDDSDADDPDINDPGDDGEGSDASNTETEYGDVTENTPAEIENGWTRASASMKVKKGAEVKVCLIYEGTSGRAWFDCVQLEEGSVPGQYNLLENASFEQDSAGTAKPSGWEYKNDGGSKGAEVLAYTPSTAKSKRTDAVHGYNSFKITAEPSKNKQLIVKPGFGSEKASYVFSAFVKADLTPSRKKRRFEIRAYDEDKEETIAKVRINTSVKGWQYVTLPMRVRDWSGTSIRIIADNEYGTVLIDNCMLAKNEVQTKSYTSDGKLRTSKVREKTTTYGTNKKDLRSSETMPAGAKNTYKYYTSTNLMKEETRAGKANTKYTYDKYGNETVRRDYKKWDDKSLSVITTKGYTEDGRFLAYETDSRGNKTGYEYDSASGSLTGATDPQGTETVYSYDPYGLADSVSSQGSTVSFRYDDKRQLSEITLGDGGSQPQAHYSYKYDTYGNLKSVKSGRFSFVKDTTYIPCNGPLLKTKYGNGQTLTNTYDLYERIVKQAWNAADRVTYEYDNRGQIARVRDYGSERTYRYDYDSAGRTTTLRIRDDGAKEELTAFQNTYDKAGRIKTFSEQYGGKVYTTGYTYRKNDQPLKATLPSGSVIENTYDRLGRVSSYTFKPLSKDRKGMEVAKTGKKTFKTSISFLDGTKQSDLTGNTTLIPKKVKLLIDEKEKDTEELSYDVMGRVEAYKNSASDLSYEYDSLGRLIKAEDKKNAYTWEYTYDSLGNITSSKLNGKDEGIYRYDRKNATVLTAYETEGKGKKASKIKYDKGGNPVSYLGMKLSWSHGRNLSGIKGKNSEGERINAGYVYDKDGIRLSKTVNGEETGFITNGSTILTQVTGDEVLNFHYDSEGKLAEIGYSKAGGIETEYVVVRNALGDVSALYTTGGILVGTYSYDPYGRLLEVKAAEGYNDENGILTKNPFRYRGYYYDSETGWYYLNSRYYDPNTKRFINADDPSYLGAGDEINSYNLFAYCGGDPVNGEDGSGHFTVSFAIGGSASFMLYGTVSKSFSFDGHGKYNIQDTYALPIVTDTKGIGFVYKSTGLQISFTDMDSVDDLNGYSALVGGGAGLGPSFGIDLIHIGRMNNDGEEINGFAISPGVGNGIDLHAIESFSEESYSGKLLDFGADLPNIIVKQLEPYTGIPVY